MAMHSGAERTDGAYLTMSVHFKLTAKRSKGAGKADCVVSAVHLPPPSVCQDGDPLPPVSTSAISFNPSQSVGLLFKWESL